MTAPSAAPTATSASPYSEAVADLLLAHAADPRPGLRSDDRVWTWAEVVRESAARAAIARELRTDGPFHVGVLLENVPEYIFWLGGAALAGASIVGINSTRRGEYLEAEVRHTECQLIITDRAGLALLDGLDVGVPRERFLLVDGPEYAARVAAADDTPLRDPAVGLTTQLLLLFTSGTTGAS